MNVISRESLVAELREYAGTLELVAKVKSAPLAAQDAREELPIVLSFIDKLTVKSAPVKVSSAKKSAPRCTWYRDIRRCYAIAREVGLDVKADDAMRAAFACFLGREVPTREVLDGDDWFLIGNAIKSRRLSW